MGLTVRTRIGFFLVVSILDVFRERLKMTGRKRRDILQRKREHRKVSRGLPSCSRVVEPGFQPAALGLVRRLSS